MTTLRSLRTVAVAAAIALGLAWAGDKQVVSGQGRPADGGPSVRSLAEPGEGLAIKGRSTQTGFVTFASSPGRGILLPVEASAAADQRAFGFVDLYGASFGLADRSQVRLLRAPAIDQLGVTHVRLQQLHKGVPVTGGELVVHLKGARVLAANGLVVSGLPDVVSPRLPAAAAGNVARQLIAKHRASESAGARYTEPRLEVFNRSILFKDTPDAGRLAWFVEARGFALREYIWVDAQSGAVLMNFSQLTDAKSRAVYNANNDEILPGTLVRSEGQPATTDVDTDNAYDLSGVAYDYFFTNHGRDSFDNLGGTIVSTVHYRLDYQNAFWNGEQLVYGDNYASADDVVGHELTHAVTERSANLLYYMQSGALNESFSDIFGETIDLENTVGGGSDSPLDRWLLGEDLPIGHVRNMTNPTLESDPGKMSDAEFKCGTNGWTNDNQDGGGVHSNSGIPNHAYALMVDGGTYNSHTITGIGLTKAAKIQYRALTTYLTSSSGFLDAYNAVNQSCSDLTGTSGITVSDCAQVTAALQAVEMNSTWACPTAVAAPVMCPTGSPTIAFRDDFEIENASWTFDSAAWGRTTGGAKLGIWSLYGENVDFVSDHSAAMSSSVTVPAGGRLYFDSAFEFENGSAIFFDGGVLEYSTNGGGTWIDAGSLIDAGVNYGGILETEDENPLGSRSAFVGSSYGYTGTRLDLASLAGQSVRFRFRIGTDNVLSSLGWLVDNVALYSCAPLSTPRPRGDDFNADGSADVAVYRKSTGTWYVRNQLVVQFGDPGDVAVSGDYDGNGTTDVAIYRPSTSTWYVRNQSVVQFGLAGDIPVPGDYNADGRTDIAVFRPSTGTWFVRNQFVAQLGQRGDVPVPADYNGDRSTDVAVYRPSTGTWYVRNQMTVQFGQPGDRPVPGDYNGDGRSDLAVHRLATGAWSVRNQFTVSFGNPGDLPVPRDYDGNGTTDVAVYRPSTGQWFVQGQFTVQFGEPGDIPVPRVLPVPPTSGDYDADSLADVSVYRPSTSSWYVRNKLSVQFGAAGDRPVPADYNGNGGMDVAVFRPSTGEWLVRNQFTVVLGDPTDVPVPGDYNGDTLADVAVYRPSTGQWFVRNQTTVQFGDPGDVPIPGDYNGDGVTDIAVYRPSIGRWFVRNQLSVQFGDPGDVPIPGDYNGDGVTDVAVYRPSTGYWYVRSQLAVQFGDANDKPVPADYNGDGRMDVAVFRPSNGTWYVRNLFAVQFGDSTDLPIVRVGGPQ